MACKVSLCGLDDSDNLVKSRFLRSTSSVISIFIEFLVPKKNTENNYLQIYLNI